MRFDVRGIINYQLVTTLVHNYSARYHSLADSGKKIGPDKPFQPNNIDYYVMILEKALVNGLLNSLEAYTTMEEL